MILTGCELSFQSQVHIAQTFVTTRIDDFVLTELLFTLIFRE